MHVEELLQIDILLMTDLGLVTVLCSTSSPVAGMSCKISII